MFNSIILKQNFKKTKIKETENSGFCNMQQDREINKQKSRFFYEGIKKFKFLVARRNFCFYSWSM